jgi:hypothetical protein
MNTARTSRLFCERLSPAPQWGHDEIESGLKPLHDVQLIKEAKEHPSLKFEDEIGRQPG